MCVRLEKGSKYLNDFSYDLLRKVVGLGIENGSTHDMSLGNAKSIELSTTRFGLSKFQYGNGHVLDLR